MTTLRAIVIGSALHGWGLQSALAQNPDTRCGASPRRAAHATAYDASRGRILLFGGEDGSAFSNALWSWNGSAWQCVRIDGPSARRDAVMAYDPVRQVLVLHGGRAGPAVLQETWELHASGWVRKSTTGPTGDPHPVMAYDNASGAILLFAGLGDDRPARATWRWDGVRWSRSGDGPDGEFPNALLPGAATLATARRAEGTFNLVLYDRRESTWVARATTGAAPAFSPQAPMARTRTGALLYAGFEPGGSVSTWILEGNTWRSHTGESPSRRRGASMTFDERRGVVVLHGGDDGARVLDDTWEWDGSNWRRVAP